MPEGTLHETHSVDALVNVASGSSGHYPVGGRTAPLLATLLHGSHYGGLMSEKLPWGPLVWNHVGFFGPVHACG